MDAVCDVYIYIDSLLFFRLDREDSERRESERSKWRRVVLDEERWEEQQQQQQQQPVGGKKRLGLWKTTGSNKQAKFHHKSIRRKER